VGQRAGGKVHRQHHAQGPAWGGLTSLRLGHMDGPKVCLFQWRIVGFCVPKWRIKVLATAGEKMLETCKLWCKNHQQYPAKDCLVFLRNHDSWLAGDELVPVRLFGWWLKRPFGHRGFTYLRVQIVKLTPTAPRNIVTILPTSIWVCLKIVYPYTQWLMIIIPTKWL